MGFFDIFKRKKEQESTETMVVSPDKIKMETDDDPSSDKTLAVLIEQLPSAYSVEENGKISVNENGRIQEYALCKLDYIETGR